MGEFDSILLNLFNRYYKVLEYKGYVKDAEVNKIMFVLFVTKLVHICSSYITEKDYNKIDEILMCMFGKSCIIPYSKNKVAIPTLYTETQLVYSTSKDNKNEGMGGTRLASL